MSLRVELLDANYAASQSSTTLRAIPTLSAQVIDEWPIDADELYEAGAIDGATGWAAFRRITLPLLMPALLIAALFRYIFAFRLFSEVWLMTGGGPARTTEVMAVYLYLEAFRYNAFGSAAATGWLLVLASLLLALVYLRGLYKEMFRKNA